MSEQISTATPSTPKMTKTQIATFIRMIDRKLKEVERGRYREESLSESAKAALMAEEPIARLAENAKTYFNAFMECQKALEEQGFGLVGSFYHCRVLPDVLTLTVLMNHPAECAARRAHVAAYEEKIAKLTALRTRAERLVFGVEGWDTLLAEFDAIA